MRRSDGSRWRGAIGCAGAALVLAGATALVTGAGARYRVVAPGLVANADFTAGVRGWGGSAGNVELLPGTPPVVRLNAGGPARPAFVARLLRRPANASWTALRVHAELRGIALVPGAAAWQHGELALITLDRHGKRLWYWPREIGAPAGDTEWIEHDVVIPVAADAALWWLGAYVAAESGSLELRGLGVDGVVERGTFTALRMIALALWLAIGSWAAWLTFRAARRPGAGAVVALLGALIVAGGLAPQPWLRDTELATLDRIGSALAQARGMFTTAAPQRASGAPASALQQGAGRSAASGGAAPARQAAGRGGAAASLPFPTLDIPLDRGTHLAAFALLALIACAAFGRPAWPACIGAALLLGLCIEAAQTLGATRDAEMGDFLFDTAGTAAGVLAVIAAQVVRRWSAVARLW